MAYNELYVSKTASLEYFRAVPKEYLSTEDQSELTGLASLTQPPQDNQETGLTPEAQNMNLLTDYQNYLQLKEKFEPKLFVGPWGLCGTLDHLIIDGLNEKKNLHEILKESVIETARNLDPDFDNLIGQLNIQHTPPAYKNGIQSLISHPPVYSL